MRINVPPIRLMPSPKLVELTTLRLPPGEKFIAWWYGAITPNLNDNWVRRVVVWFRHLRHDLSLGEFRACEVALTSLGQLRIGTVWMNQRSNEQLYLKRERFTVNFSASDWLNARCNAEHREFTGRPLIPSIAHELRYGDADRSKLLSLQHPGGSLVVPCLEFLRCYGRNQEVNRVLTIFDWDEISHRLRLDAAVKESPGHAVIELPAGLGKEDAHLLSHLRYSSFARHWVRRIRSEIEVQLGPPRTRGALAFPTIGPWFEGPCEIEVEGVRIDDQTFLGLRIVGYTVPALPDILCQRTDYYVDGQEHSGRAYPVQRLRETDDEELALLTDDLAADHGSEIVQIADPVIRILGMPAAVVIEKRDGKGDRIFPGPVPEESKVHAPGDTHGKGNGVGQAKLTSAVELQSDGAVHDLWNGLRYLQARHPHRITSLAWLTSEGMVPAGLAGKPYLMALRIPANPSPSMIRWLRMEGLVPPRSRAVLVIEVRTDEGRGYILEIERKVKASGPGVGDGTELEEESYSGLAVTAPVDSDPRDWVPRVLAQICECRGVMSQVLSSLPWLKGRDYRRPSRACEVVAGQAVAENALRKLGFSPLR